MTERKSWLLDDLRPRKKPDVSQRDFERAYVRAVLIHQNRIGLGTSSDSVRVAVVHEMRATGVIQ